jgi:hypothetical protein
MILSLGVNTLLFILGSLFSFPARWSGCRARNSSMSTIIPRALLGWRGAAGHGR